MLKLRSLKIEDEMWERWQAEALTRKVSLTALIIDRMEGNSPVAALRRLKRDPTLAVVEPSEDNTKLIAARVPSSGAHFPRTPTYWQKQQAKAKPANRGKSAGARSEDEDA